MKALEVFHPYILTDVMGCPVPTVDHRIVLAAREFCDMSGIWREWLDLVTADGTTDTFDHDLTSSQELIRYTRAIVNDEEDGEYDIVDRKSLPADWAGGASTALTDTVVHLDGATFQVFPAPASGDTIRMEAVFKPRMGAIQVGDVLYDRFAEAIAAGALARLLILPGMPWTNPQLAAIHRSTFLSGAQLAANDGFRQRKHKRTRLAPM